MIMIENETEDRTVKDNNLLATAVSLSLAP